jgi:hypothetical protein
MHRTDVVDSPFFVFPSSSSTMDTSRTDIHKGAISLEQVAACFHELASVADAIVVAQRKLSRALKDCAGLKGCPEIASTSLGEL